MKFTRPAVITAAMMLNAASLPLYAASYTVTEIPVEDLSVNQYAASIDNQGLVLVTLQSQFNLPIDYRLIDLDSAFWQAALTDIEAVRNEDPNLTDYSFLVDFVRAGSENFSVVIQQFGELLAYSYDGNQVNYVAAFDEEADAFNGFSFGMDTQAVGSVDGSHIVGNTEGPFRILEYTNEDGVVVPYVVSDFDRRAFVQVGENITPLMPIDATLGGTSTVNNISQNYTVAGTSSVSATETLTTSIESCNTPELDDDGNLVLDQPVEVCLQGLYTSPGTSGIVRRGDLWTTRATFWSLDVEGNVLDTTAYGTLFEDDDELISFATSQGLDVNTSGTGVGVSSVRVGDNGFITTAGVVFQNGETIRILEDDDLLPNSALNINENDKVIGVRSERINSAARSRMFIHDLQTSETTFVDGFFDSSGTIPRDINNNNLVVGVADSDVLSNSNSSSRPSSGFIYDIDSDIFTNLNALTSCDSEYDIIEAVAINDDDVIVASALVTRPARNVRGEIVEDTDGNTISTQTVVAVQLTPTGEAADICSDEELGILERQGASTGFLMVGLLFVGGLFRRFTKR